MAKAIIRMPDEIHRALKMEAVRQGITMQEIVQAAVRTTLAGSEKAAGAPALAARKRSDRLSGATPEETALVEALLAFLRKTKDPVRALGLRVIRAVLAGSGKGLEAREP